MKYWVLTLSFTFAIANPAMAWGQDAGAFNFVENRQQSDDVQQTRDFIKRLHDERFKDISAGVLWTLIHDYQDYEHICDVLNTTQSYMKALDKYEQDGGSSLKKLGGIRQFKDQLANWLNDDEQCVRAFAAAMLGISGDRTYEQPLANLAMKRDDPDDIIYDRGQAARALGMLHAREYGDELERMLTSTNVYDRLGAVQGLGWLGDHAYEKAMAQLLNDKEESVREAAKLALEMLRGQGPIEKKDE
jgi:HEAT repeat protein